MQNTSNYKNSAIQYLTTDTPTIKMSEGDRPHHKRPSSKKKSSTSGGGGEAKKTKKKKKPTNAEDAVERKLREKNKAEKAKAAADKALEEKIKAKQAAESGVVSSLFASNEDEKVEEGMSVSDEIEGSGYRVGSNSQPSGRSGDGGANRARGGGDVRNRPPAAPGGAELDPLRAAEEARKANVKKVNPKFADLHETGQWGGLSKWEKYGLCLLALGAIGAAIGLGIKFSGGEEVAGPTPFPTREPTASPSVSPTPVPTDSEYRGETGLELMMTASPKLTLRVQTPEELVGAKSNPNSTPQEIAAEFVMFDDELQIPAQDPRFIERYALAVFYYSNGGCSGDWITTTNWMRKAQDHCGNWYGVTCDLQGRVTELAMGENYITGKIPIEFGQFQELSTLDLSNNRMGGTIPPEALAMSSLFTLRLMNNDFSGEFPFVELIQKAPLLSKFLWLLRSCPPDPLSSVYSC
jgi:hypothetical protein